MLSDLPLASGLFPATLGPRPHRTNDVPGFVRRGPNGHWQLPVTRRFTMRNKPNRIEAGRRHDSDRRPSISDERSWRPRPFKWVVAGTVVMGLAVTGLASCSDSPDSDPLPLSEDDSGTIVEDPAGGEGGVDESGVDGGAVEGDPIEEE